MWLVGCGGTEPLWLCVPTFRPRARHTEGWMTCHAGSRMLRCHISETGVWPRVAAHIKWPLCFFSTWHAWMSLSWLWHGGPKAPFPHCCCPGAPGRGWWIPVSPPEPGGCSSLSPRQQGKRVLGIPAKYGETGHLDLLPPGLTHGGTQRGLPVAGHSPGGGDHAALRR